MDKILAFSILSSSPADLAAGGNGYYSTRLSWRTTSSGGTQKQQPQAEKQDKAEQKHQSSHPVPERKQQPRFAPEFDGLNCFESIVSI
ncbi:hypothetical protein PR202_gb18070 [Eleusine coracana subsp. coracana]|uniref:Uncharacterized protein n=1 Tax=Eleusine coracana subsp. coracana TaxID=191504 RepID=A0AAV5F521_ELECO|nr:hypothetical protein QOZ80_6BG0459600 [Eleusine coracana subsp. coracana]GJN29752.1 hypothetical protein PR202_gb18003 [Eleusine coracana subsp. coracana]GJN29815.1 hypothetical protein PR202_gb18070 [Eleusine coracana subsp. coracana]